MSQQDWLWVALQLRQRNEAGKVTVVEIRNRPRTPKDCRKFTKRYDTPELETLAAEARSGKETAPSYIRCFTPDTSSTSEASDRSLEVPQGLSDSPSTKVGSAYVIGSASSSRHSRSHGKSSSFDNLGTDRATMQIPSQPNGAPATYRPNVSSAGRRDCTFLTRYPYCITRRGV